MLFTAATMGEVYHNLSDILLNKVGEEVAPRGLRTKEIIGAQFELTNPKNCFCYNEDRRFGLKYAIVESLMLFRPVNNLSLFTHFNKNMANYSDDGKTLYGSYGYRVARAFNTIIEKLSNDSYSRQAVVTIYNTIDLEVNTKDTPCTIALQFLVRNGKLDMITTMRSNDAILGLPYDIVNFTMCQQIIANTLGIEVGRYFHQVGSLHVYEKDYEMLKSMGKSTIDYSINNPHMIDEWRTMGGMYIYSVENGTELCWGKQPLLQSLHSPSAMDYLYHERILTNV